MLIGGVLTLVVLGAVVWLAVKTADGPEPGATPHGQVQWGTLNSGAVEDAVREALGLPGPDDPDLSELARHHAFTMASRRLDGEVTPEGEGHPGRRARLTPLYVGTSREIATLFTRPPGDREAAVGAGGAERLRQKGLAIAPHEAYGVGAAVEAGTCAVVVVAGRRVATLHGAPVLGVAGGRWTLTGDAAPGAGTPLRAQVRSGTGEWMDAGGSEAKERVLGEPIPGRFVIDLDLPVEPGPLAVRLLHGGDEVLTVAIRES